MSITGRCYCGDVHYKAEGPGFMKFECYCRECRYISGGGPVMGMAVLNEIIWRTQSTDFWVSFKAFGVIPITAVFAMLQTSLIKRYSIEPATDEASDVERGDITKS